MRAVFKIIGPDIEINEVVVELIGVRVGRVEANNDLALPNARVSRQHMRFIWKNDDLYAEDLGSANGTWVNDERVLPESPVKLKESDSVTVGPYVLTLDHFDRPDIPLGAPTDEAPAEVTPPPAPEPVRAPEPEPEPEPAPEPQTKQEPAPPPPIMAEPAPVPSPAPPPPAPERKKPTLRPEEDQLPVVSGNGSGRDIILPPVEALDGYPVGIPRHASNYLKYLPSIYGEDEFLGRYLLIFESILQPVFWMVDGFDLNLSAETAPPEWLQWMAGWFDLLIVPELPVDRQRAIVRQIGWLFLRRGTRPALERLLELYFGTKPDIIEDPRKPCHFTVKLSLSDSDFKGSRDLVERLILSQKPAFAEFTLEIT